MPRNAFANRELTIKRFAVEFDEMVDTRCRSSCGIFECEFSELVVHDGIEIANEEVRPELI